MPPIYDPEAVRPMWEELANVGVRPVSDPAEVDALIGPGSTGTTLVVINSVCGCAAGGCRPGVTLALQNATIPDHLVTVFAGVDMEATARVREHAESPPSSPNVLLFKDGKQIFALERHHIERMTPIDIANVLTETFNAECSGKGPSVPPEVFNENASVRQCGSSIPLYPGN